MTCAKCKEAIPINPLDKVYRWYQVGELRYHPECYKEPVTELEYLKYV